MASSKKYRWKQGSRQPVEAQPAGEELDRIASAHEGVLRPSDVVQESRPDEALLHECFLWDDPRAAELYREDQARQIIRSVEVIIEDEDNHPRPAVAWVHIPQKPDENGNSQGYLPTAKVLSEGDLRQIALEEAFALMDGLRKRYAHLTELAEVFAALDAVQQRSKAAPEPANKGRRKRVPAPAGT